MKNDNFYMLAKTMFGLEEILADELRKLGAQNIKKMNRAVSFKGDKGFMYKANLNLRTALRILKPIVHFQAHDEKELYRKLCEIDWTEIFDLDSTFATHATTHSEVFTHSKYASLVMKDAIADTFRKKFNKRPNVDPEMPDVSINLHIAKHTCTVSLDSSGDSLHKRGYKSDAVTAPMNEVLAAGLILLSDWNRISDFHDPMCGSGTLLIEAALIAYNIPANIFRDRFGFEGWNDFDEELWKKIKEVSLDKETHYYGKITGSDNLQKAVRISIENIENALLFDNIKVKTEEVFYDPKVATDELVDSVFAIAKNRISTLKLLSYAKSAIRHNMAEDLPNLPMPVCLIWGEHDKVTPPHVAEEFHRLFSNSELHWISLCGHAAMWEHPNKFSEIALNWLKKHIKG